MIVIFFPFLLFSYLFASLENKLLVFSNERRYDYYFFSKISPREIVELSSEKRKCDPIYLIPGGKYELVFFTKKPFNNQIARLIYYDKYKDFKGNIKLFPRKMSDYSFASYYKSLKLLLRKENFAFSDQTIIELSEDFPYNVNLVKMMKLYRDSKYVSSILNHDTFFKKRFADLELFDQGIVPFLNEFLLKKVNKKDIAMVTMRDFFCSISKCSYADLTFYEKILIKFDDTYLNTKAIFKDEAAWLTVRYSHAFLKNCIALLLISLCLIKISFTFIHKRQL